MGYATTVQGVKDSLMVAVQATSTFTSSNTFADYLKDLKDAGYPSAFVRLRRDRQTVAGPKETRHLIELRVEIHHRGTGTEANLNSIIGYVGEVIDQIESDRTLGNANILNTETPDIDFTWRETESAIFYTSYIQVICELLRNV